MSGEENIHGLSQEEIVERRKAILRAYLQQFLVPSLPAPVAERLAKEFRDPSQYVFHYLTPSDTLMKQVAQCYLLSIGRRLNWFACSSHELVRSFFDDNGVIFDLFIYDIVIVYHGFASLPNKLTAGHVNQISTSRSLRGKRTLILSKMPDPEIEYPSASLPTAALRVTKSSMNPTGRF